MIPLPRTFLRCLLPVLLWTAPAADEADLRASWEQLNVLQRKQVCELLEVECRKLPTPQSRILYWVIDQEPIDAGYLELTPEAGLYCAAEHAPAYTVARAYLAEDDARLGEQRARLLPKGHSKQLRAAYRYHWASGTVVRCGDPDDPEYVFENALNGYYPGQDLALAIALKDMDDGSERAGLAAFSHSYAWNEGEVFGGITLYDAFLSGLDVDLPDVDALGLLHDTLGDWDTWSSPIEDQDGIYAVLAEEFQQLKRFRQLRESVADHMILGQPLGRNGYDLRRTQFHTLWIQAEFQPSEMRALLPSRVEHAARLLEWSKLSRSEVELFAQARARERKMEKDRGLILRVLKRQLGRVASQD